MKRFRVDIIFAVIILQLGFSMPVVAGDNGGSSYSRYGLVGVRYFSTIRGEGVGGAGMSFRSNSTIDRMNPAAWSQINRTRFSATTLYEGFFSTDYSNSTYLSKVHFQGLELAVPIAKDEGIVLGAGIAPYSRVNYRIFTPSTQGGL